MIICLPIKLICEKCNHLHTIKEIKHISIDAQKKQVFLDDMVFSCKKCKSTSTILLENEKSKIKFNVLGKNR